MLLRPSVRRFIIISAWWLRTSSKFNGQDFEEICRNFGLLETPMQVWIPPRKVVIAVKSVRIIQQLTSDAVR